MKNNEVVRIAIAETSVIIRGGLTAALKRLSNVRIVTTEKWETIRITELPQSAMKPKKRFLNMERRLIFHLLLCR